MNRFKKNSSYIPRFAGTRFDPYRIGGVTASPPDSRGRFPRNTAGCSRTLRPRACSNDGSRGSVPYRRGNHASNPSRFSDVGFSTIFLVNNHVRTNPAVLTRFPIYQIFFRHLSVKDPYAGFDTCSPKVDN